MKKTKKKIYVGSLILKILIILAAIFTIVMLGYLIVYILGKGIPHLTPSLFSLHYDSDNVSMLPSIINTLIMIGVALLIAVPIGVFSAVYLTEYAKKGNKLVKIIRTTAETLTGIPSIVYGLFGMLFFVTACHMSYSLMAGILTVAIMVLPTVLRTTEEALLAVPDSFREGSFGLGAGKLRTVFRIVLPSAIPGILSGVILSTGRIAGETAALHRRNYGNVTEKSAFFRTYAGCSHVCAFPGRSAYGSGICHRSYFAGNGTSDQHFIFRYRKENAEGLKYWNLDYETKVTGNVFANSNM